jgi:aminocarboxymuconate-semialdehyde decarboxylase
MVGALQRASPQHAPTIEDRTDGPAIEFPTGRMAGPLGRGMFDVDLRLADMDRTGIHHQVLSAFPTIFFYDLPPAVGAEFTAIFNDTVLATARAAPDRLSILASLPMQDPEAAIAEIRRVAATVAVRGVAIGSSIGTTELDSPNLEPVWAEIERHDLAVLVHPVGVDLGRLGDYHLANLIGFPLDSTIAAARVIFGGVLARHPAMRIAFVHGGGFAPYQLGRFIHGWETRHKSPVDPGGGPREAFQRLFFDGLLHDDLSTRFLIERAGAHRVMVGSDYQFDSAERDPVAAIRRLALDEPVERAVLEGTASRFLRTTQAEGDR